MSTRRRLLCLMHLPPPVHGAAVMNEYVKQSLSLASTFDMEIIPLRFAESVEDIGRISVRKFTRMVRTAVQLSHSLWREPKDVAYFAISPVGNAFYRDCVYIAVLKAFGVRRVLHLHGKGIREQLAIPWKRATYRWAFAGASLIHLSPQLANDTEGLVPPERVYFVPNGIPPGPAALAPTRASECPRILYLSNMIETKGPLVLLDALGELRQTGVRFAATFAGARSQLVHEFDRRVRRLGLSDVVSYVGPAYGAEKERLFESHDMFVLPTYYPQEAFPLVLLEAMKHGLAVISTCEGAISEIVEDGETGVLVSQRDAAGLATAIRRLAADPALRMELGLKGRERFLERYTLSHFENSLRETLLGCADA